MSDATHELSLTAGSEDWTKLRKLATTTVPAKKSALYNLNAVILGKAEVVQSVYGSQRWEQPSTVRRCRRCPVDFYTRGG